MRKKLRKGVQSSCRRIALVLLAVRTWLLSIQVFLVGLHELRFSTEKPTSIRIYADFRW